jgi:hypothetical protein
MLRYWLSCTIPRDAAQAALTGELASHAPSWPTHSRNRVDGEKTRLCLASGSHGSCSHRSSPRTRFAGRINFQKTTYSTLVSLNHRCLAYQVPPCCTTVPIFVGTHQRIAHTTTFYCVFFISCLPPTFQPASSWRVLPSRYAAT